MTSLRPPPSSLPPPAEPEDEGHGLRRLGAFAGRAAVAALLASLLPVAAALALLLAARRGARTYAGTDGSRYAITAALWLGLCFPTWLVLGAALRATTHHHALAGVTFALAGVSAALGLAWLAARLGALLAPRVPPRGVALVVVAEILLVTLLALRGVERASAQDSTASLVVDGLAALLATLLLLRFGTLAPRVLSGIGPPLAIVLLVLAGAGLTSRNGLAAAVRRHAPLYAPLIPREPAPLTAPDPALSSPDVAGPVGSATP